MTHAQTLAALLASANRLIRLAAQETGNTTPSAVWRTLTLLESDGAMRVGELAAASRISQPGMTRLLGTMADEGRIERRTDPADSRATVIAITETGRRDLAGWRTQLTETLEPWFRGLDDADWSALERTVAIIGSRTAVDAGVAR